VGIFRVTSPLFVNGGTGSGSAADGASTGLGAVSKRFASWSSTEGFLTGGIFHAPAKSRDCGRSALFADNHSRKPG
jgi:hypothetical protein